MTYLSLIHSWNLEYRCIALEFFNEKSEKMSSSIIRSIQKTKHAREGDRGPDTTTPPNGSEA
jgi:hypothetical protein